MLKQQPSRRYRAGNGVGPIYTDVDMALMTPEQLQRLKQDHALRQSVNQQVTEVIEMQSQEQTRFRSFAERYVIERAKDFRKDHDDELEDAHNAIVRAKSIYQMIERSSNNMIDREQEAQQAGVSMTPGPFQGSGVGSNEASSSAKAYKSALLTIGEMYNKGLISKADADRMAKDYLNPPTILPGVPQKVFPSLRKKMGL